MAPLFEQRLQLGNDFEILGPTGGALELDERFKRDETARHTEDVQFLGGRQQLLVAAAASDFAKEVQVAE